MTGGPDAVLVMGEALIDLVPSPDDPGTHRAQPGGAPANVAAGLARLGTPSWFAGGLGGDGFARLIEERLLSAGARLDLCARSELPTALAVADAGPDGTGYHFHLHDTATFRLPERTADVGRFGAVYAGGLAAVVAPAAEAVAATARAAAEHSVLVVDPNVREDRTLDGGPAVRRLRELCELAGILKVSDEDVTALWPDASPEDTCERLAAENGLVVLTRGPAGSTAFGREFGRVSAPAARVEVVNTIGAGDAFMAGVLNWLGEAGAFRGGAVRLSREGAGGMLTFASRVAASVVAQSGTEPSRPRTGEPRPSLPG